MHNQVAGGDFSYVERLRRMPAGAAVASRPEPGPDGAPAESSSSSDDEGSSGGGSEGSTDGMDVDGAPGGELRRQQAPVVDEDGFQVVARRGGRQN